MGLWNKRRQDQGDIVREARRIGGPPPEKSKGDNARRELRLQQARQKAAEKQKQDAAKRQADRNRSERNKRNSHARKGKRPY